jgi:chromosome segregation ATPase
MAKDFFDEDLVEARSARTLSGAPSEAGGAGDLPTRPLSDLNMSRMARYREQRVAQLAESAREAENIRRRLEELERERRQREEEVREADRFEKGRQEMLDRLAQALARLDQQEMQAVRLAELLASTRQRFREMQSQIRAIQEKEWDESRLREEIAHALSMIEDARKEYGKAMARLEAASLGGGEGEPAATALAGGIGPLREGQASFGSWFRTGLAFFLPFMIFLAVLALAILIGFWFSPYAAGR